MVRTRSGRQTRYSRKLTFHWRNRFNHYGVFDYPDTRHRLPSRSPRNVRVQSYSRRRPIHLDRRTVPQ